MFEEGSRKVLSWIMSQNEAGFRSAATRLVGAGVPQQEVQQTLARLSRIRNAVFNIQAHGELGRLADILAAPKTVLANETSEEQLRRDQILFDVVKQIEAENLRLQELVPLDVLAAKSRYLADSERPELGWIRTPSIALSWSTTDTPTRQMVGGHNLSAQTVTFEPVADLPAGQVRRKRDEDTGREIIECSHADLSKIGALPRLAARNEEKPWEEQEKLLQDQLQHRTTSQPELRRALHLETERKSNGRRGLHPDQLPAEVPGLGWRISEPVSNRTSAQLKAVAATSGAAAIIVTQLPNGRYSIAHSSSQNGIEAATLTAAVDAARSCVEWYSSDGKSTNLYLADFPQRRGRSFAESLQLQLGQRDNDNVLYVISEPGRSPDPVELSRMFGATYDLRTATVERISDPVREADGRWSITAWLKLLAKARPRPLLITVKFIFDTLGQATPTFVRDALARWQQASPADGHSQPLHLRKTLLRDLQQADPSLNFKSIEIHYSQEGRDLYADDWNLPVAPRMGRDAA